MQRMAGLSALLLCVGVTAGCGGSHVRLTALHAPQDVQPPEWLARIVGREDRLLNDRDPNGGTSYTLSKQKDVIVMFGEFATPSPAACTTSYCPVPVRMQGTSLRLVIAPRTHRLLSVTLSQRISGNQAPAIARRSSRVLRIFPARPGRAPCAIPRGGSQLIKPGGTQQTKSTLRGRCTTQFVMSPPLSRKTIRVRFGERWRLGGHAQRAAWIVTVRLRDGRVQSTQVLGQPPQLWK
jgi:hypothetical protein